MPPKEGPLLHGPSPGTKKTGQGHTYPTHLSAAKEEGRPCPVQGQLPGIETQRHHSLLREAPQLFPDHVGAIPETEATSQGSSREETKSTLQGREPRSPMGRHSGSQGMLCHDCSVTSGKSLDFPGPSLLPGLLWGFELTPWQCSGPQLARGTLSEYLPLLSSASGEKSLRGRKRPLTEPGAPAQRTGHFGWASQGE